MEAAIDGSLTRQAGARPATRRRPEQPHLRLRRRGRDGTRQQLHSSLDLARSADNDEQGAPPPAGRNRSVNFFSFFLDGIGG